MGSVTFTQYVLALATLLKKCGDVDLRFLFVSDGVSPRVEDSGGGSMLSGFQWM